MPSLRAFRAYTSCLSSTPPWRPAKLLLASLDFHRQSSNSSGSRWLDRQSRDTYSKQAKVMGLKSRAAFKLLQINESYRIFRPGMTVVDLGYAPGSWSQVAIARTAPRGRVVGVDIIPALPPKGVSTIQGNFLEPAVRERIREFLSDPDRGRPRQTQVMDSGESIVENGEPEGYIDRERHATVAPLEPEDEGKEVAHKANKPVDIVLSDMWEPWPLVTGHGLRTLTDPYFRLMNTSGIIFRDHALSIDLCTEALRFCLDVLKPGGSFVCKFYQGGEDSLLETRLKRAFEKVHREKPDSSRKESRELYFVALRLKPDANLKKVFLKGDESEGEEWQEWEA